MASQLSVFAQLGDFALSLWPLLILIAGLILLSKVLKHPFLKKVSMAIGVTLVVVLLGLKLLFLFLYPIKPIEYKVPVSENLMLKVEFSHGRLQINTNQNSGEMVLNSLDTSRGHVLSTEDYTEFLEGKESRVKAYVLRRQLQETLLTRTKSEATLLIPKDYNGAATMALYEASGEFDLKDSTLQSLTVSLFASNVRVFLPKSEKFNSFTLKGGSQLAAEIFIPEDATIVLRDLRGVLNTAPEGFAKESDGVYRKQGISSNSFELIIDTAPPRALAVKRYSQHNTQ
ncbi:MAG: hypothetical protein ACOYT9_03835 [Patescibacteria group bacterium]